MLVRFQQIPANSSIDIDAISDLSANELAVYDYIRENPRSGAAEISNETGLQRRTLTNVLKRLQKKSLVVAIGTNRAITYTLKSPNK